MRTSLPMPLRHPRVLPWAMRLDRAPALAWLALQGLALWPTWRWMGRRLQDGSDDPLGLLALMALAGLLFSVRRHLRSSPRLPWLGAALAGTLLATALHALVPPLVASLVAVLAWAAGLLAFLPDARMGAGGAGRSFSIGRLPVLGLAVLALPLIASLQFYAGYPLRVLTAEASRWLLTPWFQVWREGSQLNVNGLLVIVDAPCSGVQMAWAGYFSACATALACGRGDRAFALRLPLVGACVLAGNVLRNTVLVALETTGHGQSGAVHEAVGLISLAAVCVGIVWLMQRREMPFHRRGAEGAEGSQRYSFLKRGSAHG